MSIFAHLQVDHAISYLVAFLFPALDAIIPAVPSETLVIALGVATAGSTDPRIALLVACAAAGAFVGDNVCYLLGQRFGPAVQRRFFTTPKGKAAREWAERSLDRFGAQLIVVCRFIPGGRTAVTLTCGVTGYPRRRFVPATAAAATIWALYAFFIGRIGGRGRHGRHGVTPERLRPVTPARISAIETSLVVETTSPRKIMPKLAAPAAPMPVQTAYAGPTSRWRSATVSSPKLVRAETANATVGHSAVRPLLILRHTAKAVSNKPAAIIATHAITSPHVGFVNPSLQLWRAGGEAWCAGVGAQMEMAAQQPHRSHAAVSIGSPHGGDGPCTSVAEPESRESHGRTGTLRC
jgi:membrane-associated protein